MNTIKFAETYFPVEVEVRLEVLNEMKKLKNKYDFNYETIIELCMQEDFDDRHLENQFIDWNIEYASLRVDLHIGTLRELNRLSKEHDIGFRDIIEQSVGHNCKVIDSEMEPYSNKTQDIKLEGFVLCSIH